MMAGGLSANAFIIGLPARGAGGPEDYSSPMEFVGDLIFCEHKIGDGGPGVGNVAKIRIGMSRGHVREACASRKVPVWEISEDEWRVGTGTILFRDGTVFAGVAHLGLE